ncbi:MAG: helix-turn-helix domain-containing protein, partial [Chlorobium sp.]|nr:helix-turn-helix domain-containing protein [Chlorobium sp.]
MGYSHAVRHSVLKKVLPPEGRSIAEVSRETGVNQQTIRNWIKRSETGIFEDGNQDSCPRFLTPREKYQLVVEAAGIEDEQLGEFLRERGLHSEHITIWDHEQQRKEKALAEAAGLLI